MQHELICFARGTPGEWEGVCLNFDIAVQGESFEGVRRTLEEAIALYVESAMKEDEATRERLLNRAAPLSEYLRWSWRIIAYAIASTFSRRRGDGGGATAQFPIACPA
jgi:hypothetical protein